MPTRLSFRARLGLIVGTTGLAFLLLIATSRVSDEQSAQRIADVRARLLPKVERGPSLLSGFERLQRRLQDAVAAQDLEVLAEAHLAYESLDQELDDAGELLGRAPVQKAGGLLGVYFRQAEELAKRLIAGETGEDLVGAMEAMQARQNAALAALKEATAVSQAEIEKSFASIEAHSRRMSRQRLLIIVGCLAVVLAFSLWSSRVLINVVAEISRGLERFGQGDFSQSIARRVDDELGGVAGAANHMAENLRRLGEERSRNDWIKTGQVRLAEELREDISPEQIGARVIRLLTQHLQAPAGAFYDVSADGTLILTGSHALEGDPLPGRPVRSFRPGEGLVGQAARSDEVKIIENPPTDYLKIRSGLGERAPGAVVLVPLRHTRGVRGVVELALFSAPTPTELEFLTSVQEPAALALEAAHARTRMRELLAQSQAQTERLAAQEEELRANNEELELQQNELRRANEVLEDQRLSLEKHNISLEATRHQLELKTTELLEASGYKSRFLANMSHELRTPLNSMLLLSSLLADNENGNLSEKQVEYCHTIHGAGKDLLQLINQILDLSKIEAGKQTITAENVRISDVLEHLRRIFAPMAADKGLTFAVHMDPGLPERLITDRRRLEQILTNLIGNAIKFTTAGEIGLRVQRPPQGLSLGLPQLSPSESIVFAVRDSGVGIAHEEQERIFAPFEQLDAGIDRRYGGTGLGLAIARELTLLLGGEMRLSSRPGAGSTFLVILPQSGPPDGVRAEDSTTPTTSPAPLTPVPFPSRSGDGAEPRLLVVEDDPVFAERLADLIRERGFVALLAKTGEEGIRLARSERPQGIVLDVRLPDTDGFEVLRRLRADAQTASIPVHFLSAIDMPERGVAMGAVGYLTKPASRAELAAVVQTLVGPIGGAKQPILVACQDSEACSTLLGLLQSEGWSVEWAKDSAQVMARLERGPFTCLVLDVDLPDMGGLDLLARLAARTEAVTPPVIVLTGRSLSKTETQQLEAYAETVVLDEGRAAERLLEEIRLFVQHVKTKLGPEQRPPLPRPSRALHLRGKKVLLVDDDMRTVYALSALLRTKQAEVLVADTGKVALDHLAAHPDVNVVLMDIMMPEMDGYEAMRRIRQEERFSHLPIVALTAKAMQGEKERCLEAGANEYVPKPVESDRLLDLLDRLVSRPGGPHAKA